MDNKYGLGSTKVAQVHHDAQHKETSVHPTNCKFCGSNELTLSPTMHDHLCNACGEWQNDVPQGYSTGRSSDY
jgi:hypothetical protein